MNVDLIIISCGAKKRTYQCKAEDMYIGPLFKASLEWAKKQPIPYFIVSTKYGLLKPTDIIKPYEMTLKEMNKSEIIIWAKNIAKELPKNKKIICVTSKIYSLFSNYYNGIVLNPLVGLGIGKRIKWFKENKCIISKRQ